MQQILKFIKAHISTVTVPVVYDKDKEVYIESGEVYWLAYDRKSKRLFISLPYSMKREELKNETKH